MTGISWTLKRSYHKYFFALAAVVFPASILAAAAAAGGLRPAPVPRESYCAACGMRVAAEDRFASQIIFKDGKTVFFCDLGDLLFYYEGHNGGRDASAVFVRDFASGGWIDGKGALYLTGAKVRTPMRYGILAFGEEAAAQKFRLESGGERLLTFGQAVAGRIWEE